MFAQHLRWKRLHHYYFKIVIIIGKPTMDPNNGVHPKIFTPIIGKVLTSN